MSQKSEQPQPLEAATNRNLDGPTDWLFFLQFLREEGRRRRFNGLESNMCKKLRRDEDFENGLSLRGRERERERRWRR